MAMNEQDTSRKLSADRAAQRSFYSATAAEFLATAPGQIIGQLSSRHVALHSSAKAEQIWAWEAEIDILRKTLSSLNGETSSWVILMETPLFRLGKRLDAVVLAPGVVAVIEFKIGAKSYLSSHCAQLERYALSLKDFHKASQTRLIFPILCAEHAPPVSQTNGITDGVANLIFANRETLVDAFRSIQKLCDSSALPLDGSGFDFSDYRPTPTIVEAAQALYAGHAITDIGRGDAVDEELQRAADALRTIASEAEAHRKKVVCFVTGAPGAGKTLLGLDLALKGRSGTRDDRAGGGEAGRRFGSEWRGEKGRRLFFTWFRWRPAWKIRLGPTA